MSNMNSSSRFSSTKELSNLLLGMGFSKSMGSDPTDDWNHVHETADNYRCRNGRTCTASPPIELDAKVVLRNRVEHHHRPPLQWTFQKNQTIVFLHFPPLVGNAHENSSELVTHFRLKCNFIISTK